MKLFRNIFNDTRIKTKILYTHLITICICFIITLVSFNIINQSLIEKEIKTISDEVLVSVDKYLDSVFKHINEVTNVFFFEPMMQELLTKIDSEVIDPKIQSSITQRLSTMALSVDYISSIYIFDNYDNYYFSHYTPEQYQISEQNITSAIWYDEVEALNGSVAIVPNCGGFLLQTESDVGFISLIRNILSLDDYQKIGTLIINIDNSKVQSYLNDITLTNDGDYFITDANNQYIIPPTNNQKLVSEYLNQTKESEKESRVYTYEGRQYYLTSIPSQVNEWTIHSLIPMRILTVDYHIGNFILLVIVAILFLVILYCLILTSKWIFTPLHDVLEHMQAVQRGQFKIIPIGNTKEDEITILKHGFNEMIEDIQELLQKTEEEQDIIRKNELEIIQAQVKPHFLYNTLDAINALALMGEHENVAKMISSLGTFYRNSLNGGKDLVTVAEELECIRSYITILNIRYDHKLTLEIDVEEEMLDLKILKLILQPIVENAVYHGVREITKGHIKVVGYLDEEEMIFIISDNGVGMSSDIIQRITNNTFKKEKGGFGIYSCIQRISLYYKIEKPVTIISEMDFGTEVIIKVKTVEDK